MTPTQADSPQSRTLSRAGQGPGHQRRHYRELARLQLHRLRSLRPSPSRPQGRFRACPPGFLHIDTFALPRLGGPRRYLFVAIDRATRLMTMQVAPARTMAHAGAFLIHCQRFYPFRPYGVLTDNGREFTLRATEVGMEPAPPRCIRLRSGVGEAKSGTVSPGPIIPWTNGLVERTGGTIKAETIYRWHFDSTAMLDAALYGFERYFNEHRPYKAMGGKTPAQLTQEWYHRAPKRFLRQPIRALTTW